MGCYSWFQNELNRNPYLKIWGLLDGVLGIIDNIEIGDLGKILENNKDLSYKTFEYEMLLGEICM